MKVLRRFRSVMVTKLVMTTSSVGIIIRDRNRANTRSLPLKFSRAKPYAASTVTMSIRPVVTTVKTMVLRKYPPSGTCVKAST